VNVKPGGTYSDHWALEGELEFIWRTSSYRAVNALHLGYKNQSVYAVWENNRCLFSHPHKT
jgi:hypothetical protein